MEGWEVWDEEVEKWGKMGYRKGGFEGKVSYTHMVDSGMYLVLSTSSLCPFYILSIYN